MNKRRYIGASVDQSIYDKVVELAKHDNRTISNYIVNLIMVAWEIYKESDD